jgi:hypothetical protein
MAKKETKVHTGFRLSKNNLDFIEDMGNSLGLNKTNVVDMILTIVRNDTALVVKLIKNSITKK